MLAKFKYIDEFNKRRRASAEIYNKGLSGIEGIVLPSALSSSPSAEGHVVHQYTIRVMNGKREAMQKHLQSNGVSSMIYYAPSRCTR